MAKVAKTVVFRGRGRFRYADFEITEENSPVVPGHPGRVLFEVRPSRIRRWHWTYWWMVLRIIMKIH